ncbi:hypothetical protein POHY109586_12595 [Polaromonas hydrogenivorans]
MLIALHKSAHSPSVVCQGIASSKESAAGFSMRQAAACKLTAYLLPRCSSERPEHGVS